MTVQEREQIISKDYLDVCDIQVLLGVPKQTAYKIIRQIRRQTDRLGLQGKIHIQDYIDYFNLDIKRYKEVNCNEI